MPGSVLGAVAGKAASSIGNSLFGGGRRARAKAAGKDVQAAEDKALGYMDTADVDPQLNQMTQDAITRATEKAGAQLGVSQAQGGVTGGQAMQQQARQAGGIQKDLQYSDSLQRRKELLGGRAKKASYFGGKVGNLLGG